jgi:mRNA interferase MazF
LNRGDVVTVTGGSDYAGKPRPAVIVQNAHFDATESVTVCLFTTNAESASFRVAVQPNAANGLVQPSWAMADKVMSVPREKVGRHIGRLTGGDIERLNRALSVFLGLAG